MEQFDQPVPVPVPDPMSSKLPEKLEYKVDDSPLPDSPSSPSGFVESTPPPPRGKWSARKHAVAEHLNGLHNKTPFLNRLPAYVLFPITLLIIVQCVVWAVVGVVLRFHPYLANQLV